MTWAETVVIGGGPAGSATACGLARSGHDVMLIERAAKPHHKVCGEFLSAETLTFLQRLGLDPLTLGAMPIDQLNVYSAGHSVSSELPFRALSLSRYRLDEALLRCAQSSGARLARNVTAQSVKPSVSGWNVFLGDGETIQCDRLVLATGKVGLRGIDDTRDGSMVGLKMHLRPSPATHRALTGRAELFFLDCGYIGLELVEDGIANLCMVIPRVTMSRLGPGWRPLRNHLASTLPILAEQLTNVEPLWGKPIAVVCPTGGYLHRERKPTIYRVGDRLAHIPPLTGDGIAIALGSAALAVEHIRLGFSPEAYLAAARQLTAGPIRRASIVSYLIKHSGSRNLMLSAAARAPNLIETIARRTRLTPSVDRS